VNLSLRIKKIADRYFEEMNRFLMPRYDIKGTGRYVLAYDERDVKAMVIVMINRAKSESEIGVSTENELREMIGRDERENGDVIIKKAGSATLEQIVEGSELVEPEQETKMTRDDFIKLMKNQVDNDGERKYSDVYIMKQANEMSDLT